jgi:hypothetical protein
LKGSVSQMTYVPSGNRGNKRRRKEEEEEGQQQQ